MVLAQVKRALAYLPMKRTLPAVIIILVLVTFMLQVWTFDSFGFSHLFGRSSTRSPSHLISRHGKPLHIPRSIAENNDKGNENDKSPTTPAPKTPTIPAPRFYANASSVPNVLVKEASCAKLFEHDHDEIQRANAYQKIHPKVKLPDSEYSKITNCEQYQNSRKYILKPVNKEEEDFPIAYSVVMFKDVELFERLLRAIYRPQNYYCIHVDKKSSRDIWDSVKAITGCFENVFLSSKVIDVQWAYYSVLEPDLVCMEDLWKHKKWKYFINLTGQEFPLRTNWEIVKILKIFNGANSMEGTVKRRNAQRTDLVHDGFFPTNKRKGPQPHNIRLTKGSVHIVASRAFVDYVLHDQVALDFRAWVRDTGVPDETFFSSLNHNPELGVPGAYKGEPETDQRTYPFPARFKNWGDGPFNWPCEGQRVRMVCIFSVGDLRLLKSRPELFANKFYIDYQTLSYDCMEELLYNRTRSEILGKESFDTTYYENLSFVKNHV